MRWVKLSGVASLAFLAMAPVADAQEIPPEDKVTLHVQLKAGELYDMCLTKEGDFEQILDNHICAGYLSGAQDGIDVSMAHARLEPHYCIPTETTRMQLLDIFLKYMKDRPAARERPAAAAVIMAYRDALPCPRPARP